MDIHKVLYMHASMKYIPMVVSDFALNKFNQI